MTDAEWCKDEQAFTLSALHNDAHSASASDGAWSQKMEAQKSIIFRAEISPANSACDLCGR